MSHDTATILLYSDDRSFREQVRLTIGRRVAADLPPVTIYEVATAPALLAAVDAGGIDLIVLDAEATPAGGLGLCKQLKDEIADCPPVLVLIIRVVDSWLTTWAHADAVSMFPVDPVRLPGEVAELLRARLSQAV